LSIWVSLSHLRPLSIAVQIVEAILINQTVAVIIARRQS
jgi:hypothetical protein